MLYAAHDGANAAFDMVEIAAHGLAVTHLDAVAHMFAEGRSYNGRSAASTVTPAGLTFGSIHAQRDGILTRGVLLDVAAFVPANDSMAAQHLHAAVGVAPPGAVMSSASAIAGALASPIGTSMRPGSQLKD